MADDYSMTACGCHMVPDCTGAGFLAEAQAEGLASGLTVLQAAERALVVAPIRHAYRAAFPWLKAVTP